ncbi:transcription factor bHLH68-like [Rutidosis leptorrhynchoides]|uniref:transcription factor bHLH68-like n=1 Tax=Rutidosis leptorrhynchoides TaxID=125765 RepID=UPI003A9932F6
MMAGSNPSWWSMYSPPPQQPSTTTLLSPSLFPPQYVLGSSSSSPPPNSLPLPEHNSYQELPQSWSRLLLGGLSAEEDRLDVGHFQQKKLENWEDQQQQIITPSSNIVDIKQEGSHQHSSNLYGRGDHGGAPAVWSSTIMPMSNINSPKSCVTSLNSNNILDFSHHNKVNNINTLHADHSSECNSTATGGVTKKARVQSSSQPPLKVRKEKLGDRVTALHQLVSPFGKTDTASVLLEAIGYIRFLQGQIEALSSPYMGKSTSSNLRNQQFEHKQEKGKDLKSRGLCLVPVSCTQQVGSDNGADYWAPAAQGGDQGF